MWTDVNTSFIFAFTDTRGSKRCHLTSNLLPHYFVKFAKSVIKIKWFIFCGARCRGLNAHSERPITLFLPLFVQFRHKMTSVWTLKGHNIA